MKTKLLAAMLEMVGTSLCGGQSAMVQRASVTVCMDSEASVLMGVRPLTSAIFGSIGVRIDWSERHSCPSGVGAIKVNLCHDLRAIRGSEALGFALPYQATITVFVDRVQASNRDGMRSVMAHVLVHEITHVLEGIDRHSAIGIMKARWSDHDFGEMRRKPLPFAQEDVNLIYAGLKVPSVAPAVAVTRVAIAGH